MTYYVKSLESRSAPSLPELVRTPYFFKTTSQHITPVETWSLVYCGFYVSIKASEFLVKMGQVDIPHTYIFSVPHIHTAKPKQGCHVRMFFSEMEEGIIAANPLLTTFSCRDIPDITASRWQQSRRNDHL